MKNRIREVRKQVGMPMAELARRAKISRNHLFNIEKNKAVPSAPVLFAIADALNKSAKELLVDDVTHDEQNTA